MNPIKNFSATGVAAVSFFLSKMNDGEKNKIEALFDAGNALAMSLVIQPDGSSVVMLECVLVEGDREVLAHVNGQPPSFQ